jgi:peptidoglycan/xylan/chitin deacetylase (PgdA/CDA1 family)
LKHSYKALAVVFAWFVMMVGVAPCLAQTTNDKVAGGTISDPPDASNGRIVRPPASVPSPQPRPAPVAKMPVFRPASGASLHRTGESTIDKPDGISVKRRKPLVAGDGARPPADCAREDALGTSRTIVLGTKNGLKVGWKTYPETLQLADKEVVLTFDDGPQPGTTERILDALETECVKATFFLIGKNALANRQLVVRELAEGHSLGNHSWSHPAVTLRGLSKAAAIEEAEKGFSAIAEAADGHGPVGGIKFFRFPGFADTPALQQYLASKDVAIFGTDLWASDWRSMVPEVELQLLMGRLNEQKRGIILLHDTRGQTAAMVPALLRRLKEEGYKVVHLVQAAGPPPELATAPEGWSPETETILSRVMPRLLGAKPSRPATAPDTAAPQPPPVRTDIIEPDMPRDPR